MIVRFPWMIKELLLLLLLVLFPIKISAQEGGSTLFQLDKADQAKIDSFTSVIQSTEGQKRLDTYTDLIDFLFGDVPFPVELHYLYAYLDETQKQNNLEEEAFVRIRISNVFYNENMEDSLFVHLKNDMDFFAQKGLWEYYYNSWEMKISQYLHSNRLESALREAKAMYEKAHQQNYDYGMGISAFVLGKVYSVNKRYHESELFLKEAIPLLEKESSLSNASEAYSTLSAILSILNKYEETLKLTEQWERMIDNYEAKLISRGMSPDMNNYRFYCTISRVEAYINIGDEKEVEKWLDKAASYLKSNAFMVQYAFLEAQAGYYELIEDYENAIRNIDIVCEYRNRIGDKTQTVELLTRKAKLLRKNGQSQAAAAIYEQLITERDSIRSVELSTQMHDIALRYEVDRLNSQKEQAHVYLWITIGIVVLLLLVLGFWVLFSTKIVKRYQDLNDYMQEQGQIKENITQLENDIKLVKKKKGSTYEENKSIELFNRLNEYLITTHCYTRLNLDSDELTRILNTNKTYLYSAVREATGQSLSEYLYSLRLRKACELLLDDPDKTMDRISAESGFKSTRNFYRLFRQQYNCSPNEYRDMHNRKE